jgi:hypothetical protein
MKRTLPDDVLRTLINAERTRGWNCRPRDVRQFELGVCVLYVVPCARWAYRRIERQAHVLRDKRARV